MRRSGAPTWKRKPPAATGGGTIEGHLLFLHNKGPGAQ